MKGKNSSKKGKKVAEKLKEIEEVLEMEGGG